MSEKEYVQNENNTDSKEICTSKSEVIVELLQKYLHVFSAPKHRKRTNDDPRINKNVQYLFKYHCQENR